MHPKASLYLNLFNGVKDFRELEQRICALPDTGPRGAAMEVFAEAYLSLPCLATINAKKVWTEKEIPPSIKKQLFLSSTDKGVDGVLETQTGEYYAYQVKFRSDRSHRLSWKEISTFVGMSDHAKGKLLITNCLDFSDDAKDRKGFWSITGHPLNHLTAQDFQNIYNWIKGRVIIHKRNTPRPHQKEALADILSSLQTMDRATVVMACGTGKTLVEMWTAEQREAKLVLVLVPSLMLMGQILPEWVRQIHHSMAYLCVCSDPTVTQGRDEVVLHASSVDFPVTTDAEQVTDFLHTKFDGMKVVFSTYHSAGVVADGLKISKVKSFDLGIFDEAHKTAGDCKKTFGLALHQNRLPIKKRIFFTATPRHYRVQKDNKEGNKKLVFSMDVPEVYGPVVHKLSFAKAVKDDIICGYKVIISVVTSEEVNHQLLKGGEVIVNGDGVRARQVANQLALKHLTKHYEVNKIFTFHRTVASAKSFTSPDAEGIGTHLPAFKSFHVDGTMPSSQRKEIMQEFRNADKGLISNARCLTEGVDVPAVDLVAFMATKKSHVDIVQATGRAMRKSPGKKVGYIFLPLYLEQEEGETLEQALKRAKYNVIWDVLEALAEQDEVLAEIITNMRIKRGQGILGFDDQRFHEKVDVLASALSLKTLRKAITTRCVEVCSEMWDYRYGQLQAYKKKHGDFNVLREGSTYSLALWINTQRVNRRAGILSEERIHRLDEIGFIWEPLDAEWDIRFAEYKAFREQHGDRNVPTFEPNSKKFALLGLWVANQRTAYKDGRLSEEQIQKLEALGFAWRWTSARWNNMFTELQAYKEKHGDCNVTVDTSSLGKWVGHQKTAYNNGRLSEERVLLLEGIGFVWSYNSSVWDTKFAELKAYKEKHGDCNVLGRSELGKWMHHQRGGYKKGALSKERIRKLNGIGFPWIANVWDNAWETKFIELQEYKEQHGDCNVPQSDSGLGSWVGKQRESYRVGRTGRLSKERIRKLEGIGFVWTTERAPVYLSEVWKARFAELVAYKEKHGDCNVPGGTDLGEWVAFQRRRYTTGELSEERTALLNGIGFVWNSPSFVWDTRFNELQAYKEQHGDCNIPCTYKENRTLGLWVSSQRMAYREGYISKEHIQRLNSIGFVWELRSSEWDQKFTELVTYKEEHGDCNVPNVKGVNGLGPWVNTQKVTYKKGKLSEERVQRLNSIGFVWDQLSFEWGVRFKELQAYKEQHGDCNVVCADSGLGAWVSLQRRYYKQEKMSEERFQHLNGLGFCWSLK